MHFHETQNIADLNTSTRQGMDSRPELLFLFTGPAEPAPNET
jgi:hypothetical protein